jgi:transcriptional regulator with XRE-family HTH domain
MLSIRKQKNLKQTNFSKLIGVSSSYLSLVELDKQRPSLTFIMSVLKATKVNGDWLLTGKGSMYLPIEKEKQEIKEINEDRAAYGGDNSPGLNDELNDLKSHWSKLNDDQKRALMVVVKEMIEKNEMKEFVLKFANQSGELLQVPS